MQKKTKKGYLGRESLVEKLVIPVEDVKAQSRRGCGSGEEGRHPHPEHVPHPQHLEKTHDISIKAKSK